MTCNYICELYTLYIYHPIEYGWNMNMKWLATVLTSCPSLHAAIIFNLLKAVRGVLRTSFGLFRTLCSWMFGLGRVTRYPSHELPFTMLSKDGFNGF